MPTNGALAVLSWSGMRGAVTLAAALALPLTTNAGAGFPERNLIIFLAFAVIVVTLVVQGLTLPALVRAVDLPTDPREPQEEASRGSARSRRGWRGWRSCTTRSGSTRASCSGCATRSSCGWPSTPRARTARRTTSARSGSARRGACAASCWTPSGPRWSSCAAQARSATRSSGEVLRELDFEDARLGGG